MNRETVSQALSLLDEKYIDEATVFAVNKKRDARNQRAPAAKRARGGLWRAAAACAASVAVIGAAVCAFTAEAKNYNAAAAFFAENGLSTDGLRRAEVKAVYRDITQKKFTYEKTADVLRQAVPGWQIGQAEPTPEELADVWNKNVWGYPISQKGVSCRIETQYVPDPQKGFEVLDKSVLECYRDGEQIWSAEFKGLYAEGAAYTEDGTAVWGRCDEMRQAWIALVNGEGAVLWQTRLKHGFKNEYVASVLNNGDGTWAVISRGDLNYLCLSCYGANGKKLRFHKTEVGNLGIKNAARLGDGYIVQLYNKVSRVNALLYKLDREGRVTDSFSYEAEDCEYYITDMAEFEGRIYLSAYAVPVQTDAGGRYEIGNLLEYIFSKEEGGLEISGEELTPLVRENYTAVLLLCDPNGGSPKTFWSVEGSLGGKLNVNDAGLLEWNVESVTSAFFSPATSSFSIGGTCKVFRYTFNAGGELTGQADTGETVPYHR